MNNIFDVNDVKVNHKCLECTYSISGDWEKYFTPVRQFEVKYSVDIADVPESIAVLPLLCNILPIAWIMDATVMVQNIDSDFYNHIEDIKAGYKNMYPKIGFNGQIVAGKVCNNALQVRTGSDTAVFFSGGVDAYTSLFRFHESLPYIMTVWGSDIKLSDVDGWTKVWFHSLNVAEEYGGQAISIKSNFRSILNEGLLSDYVIQRAGDGWWHGFQHGIGIIGHAAPLGYALGLSKVCIASSFPSSMKGQYTCASDPTIDEKVHFSGCEVIHDGYELNRQEKVQYIIDSKRKLQKPVELRVCWESSGGSNCCACEKCYRTILEIVSEGDDPNEYGFVWDKAHIKKCKKDMKYKINIMQSMTDQFYPVIQKRMICNKDRISNYNQYRWLLNMDFRNFNRYPIKVLRTRLGETKLAGMIWKLLFEKKQ